MTWERTVDWYLDVDKSGGRFPLLDGESNSVLQYNPSMVQGDKFPLRLFFRSVGAVGGTSTSVELGAEDGIVLAGKLKTELADGTTLFSQTSFTKQTVSGDVCYRGTLSLPYSVIDTALGSEDSITCRVDIEVSAVGNTARSTFQFDVEVYRQVYSDELAEDVLLTGWGRFEWPTDPATGKQFFRVRNTDGETLLEAKPPGV